MTTSRFAGTRTLTSLATIARLAAYGAVGLSFLLISTAPGMAALVHRWRFDEPNGTAPPQVQNSISSNHGFFVAMDDTNRSGDKPLAVPGGRSLLFNGVDERVDLTSQITLTENSNFTVAFWYRGTETGETDSWGRAFIGRNNNDVYANIIVRGGFVEYLHHNGGWQHNIKSTTLVNDDAWHHIAYVNYSNETGQLYIDGTLETPIPLSSSTDGLQYRIDGFMYGFGVAPINRYTDGKLDDARIYDNALTSEDILALVTTVPEPGTGLLLVGGLVLFGRRVRRQRPRHAGL